MSSKINTKSSKKDRPRSSDKLKKGSKRDGTPEKPTTPNASQGELEEGLDESKKNIIINDEILALQIKPEELQNVREPQPPSEKRTSPTPCSVVVRKLKPASELNKPKPKIVTVAKLAPPDAPVKPIDYSYGSGPRIQEDGTIVPHSILGSIEDYKKMAQLHGDLPSEMTTPRPDSQQGHLTVKYEKKRKPLSSTYPKFESVEESNALKNWQEKMLDRQRQQNHISKLLNKPVDDLVMNQADSYRKTQETRYVIDRTIPFVDYGKGYRIGSEFWKQQDPIGDDLTGLHVTLTQTEKGYPPPIEHVAVPTNIKKEKGTYSSNQRSPFHKPWHRNTYFVQRKAELQPMIDELDPHQPDLQSLEIVGRNRPWSGRRPWSGSRVEENRPVSAPSESRVSEIPTYDPLSDHPDVHPEPVFGPSIQFAGQPARWTGDSTSFIGTVGIEARVTFEEYSGKRTTSFLEISNDGTTSIYYDWKKIPKTNPFDMVDQKVQRFYFNTSSGVILPGASMKFPFVFKSPNAGVFSEQWEFQTSPTVIGGAALLVTLRGVALQEDKFFKQRSDLEKTLAHRQSQQIVCGILGDVLEGIRTPDRPSSPIDAYITEEEIFSRKNAGLNYHNETITKLKQLYKETLPEEEKDTGEWDLSVDSLKDIVMSMDDSDDIEEGQELSPAAKKQELLNFFNKCIISISFPVFTPKQQKMRIAGYTLMCELVDCMISQALELRYYLGLPESDDGGLPDEPMKEKVTESDQQGAKGETKKGGKSGKGDPKKKETKSGNKAAKEAQKPTKVSSGKRPATREKSDRQLDTTPSSEVHSPLPTSNVGDPIVEAKFKEKLYSQTHELFLQMADKISMVFSGIEENEGVGQLPQM